MKAWSLIVLLAVVLLTAGTAMADVTATGDLYYYLGPPLNAVAGDYDPVNDDPSATDWNPNFIAGTPPAGTIPVGQVLVLAQRNLQLKQVKYVTANVQYTGTSPLVTYDRIGHGARDYITTHYVLGDTDVAGTPRSYTLRFKVKPQPDWEWVELTPAGAAPVPFTRATIHSVCVSVPSTTTTGLIVLVVLLGGTAVWIVGRRRLQATA